MLNRSVNELELEFMETYVESVKSGYATRLLKMYVFIFISNISK